MQFATFRLIILAVAVFAQLYLFARLREAVLSSGRSDRFKSRAIPLAGAAIGLLFATNTYMLARRVVWVDPPMVVRALLFYLPAIWTFGSIFSALLLCVAQAAGWLVRTVIQLHRRQGGQNNTLPENSPLYGAPWVRGRFTYCP